MQNAMNDEARGLFFLQRDIWHHDTKQQLKLFTTASLISLSWKEIPYLREVHAKERTN